MIRLSAIHPENKDLSQFEFINAEAFPPSEYVSFATLFHLAEEMVMDILGVYDEEMPVGFTVIVKNDQCAYIFLLGTDKRK